jgi:hypothetical protein
VQHRIPIGLGICVHRIGLGRYIPVTEVPEIPWILLGRSIGELYGKRCFSESDIDDKIHPSVCGIDIIDLVLPIRARRPNNKEAHRIYSRYIEYVNGISFCWRGIVSEIPVIVIDRTGGRIGEGDREWNLPLCPVGQESCLGFLRIGTVLKIHLYDRLVSAGTGRAGYMERNHEGARVLVEMNGIGNIGYRSIPECPKEGEIPSAWKIIELDSQGRRSLGNINWELRYGRIERGLQNLYRMGDISGTDFIGNCEGDKIDPRWGKDMHTGLLMISVVPSPKFHV